LEGRWILERLVEGFYDWRNETTSRSENDMLAEKEPRDLRGRRYRSDGIVRRFGMT